MNAPRIASWCIVAALAALGTCLGLHKVIAAQPAPTEGVEVLTRGPVHEAFAETVTFDPVAGIAVPKTPPAAIEEVPPEQKPEGTTVAWISGYWGWDDERSDFLWVSGIWRDLPPGRQWVPGYWGKSGQGYQWTSGYWANAQVNDVEYLPVPPTTVETGPNIDAPSPNDSWLPGCWVWQNGRYAWRPGFWAPMQPNWDWIPAYYVWSPRGYVFVDGYWDYSIDRRGLLFAPVYFDAGVYGRQGFSYSPTTVINPAVFANHLFLRPQYQHYYFGDYYAADYQAAGFYPSYSYNSGRSGYDPIYAYARWQHRQESGWEHRQAADFANRRDHEAVRPPRTWAAQRELDARAVQSRERGIVMAAPLDHLIKSKDSPLRFQPVDQSERRQFSQRAQEVQRFREERQKLETKAVGASAETRTKEVMPAKVKLPGSPIVAKPVADLGKDRAPPKTYEAPKPDPRVQPKPNASRPAPQPQPQPKAERPVSQPQPQPKAERPASQPQPQPKAERPASQPQPQPKAERPASQPQPQPKAERPASQPQPQPKAERPASQPQPQPKVDRSSPQPQSNAAGAKEDKPKGKDK